MVVTMAWEDSSELDLADAIPTPRWVDANDAVRKRRMSKIRLVDYEDINHRPIPTTTEIVLYKLYFEILKVTEIKTTQKQGTKKTDIHYQCLYHLDMQKQQNTTQ
mmetsp:Transcript_4440/g.4918  ORF Transcript_4440/g.4918 Transcript_4440/m.4918 type:complete len:105 (+) Transcript_4440:225-539(+)